MVPALAILAARRMPGVAWPGAALPVAFSLLLSVWVALGDSRLAASAREAAQTLRERYGPSLENVHFEGHWGFQHYMEGLGASAVDYARSEFEPGDLIVVALNNTNLRRPPQDSTVVSSELQVPTGGWVSTMSDGAGFYTSSWGPFPFVVGPTEPERYRIYEVLRDFRFSGAP
jgi:hypothetical protein